MRQANTGGTRWLEWGLLALLIAVLWGVFMRQMAQVQGQAERASVASTVGALRTALVLQHLQQHLRGPAAQPPRSLPNPFHLLQPALANFAGAASVASMDQVEPGQWVFDADCGCIGYRLRYPEWLQQPQGVESVWFRLQRQGNGVIELHPFSAYVWSALVLQ